MDTQCYIHCKYIVSIQNVLFYTLQYFLGNKLVNSWRYLSIGAFFVFMLLQPAPFKKISTCCQLYEQHFKVWSNILNSDLIKIYFSFSRCFAELQCSAEHILGNSALHYMISNYLINLTLILLTWRIWRAPNNVSRWQMWFNSPFKGLSGLQRFNMPSWSTENTNRSTVYTTFTSFVGVKHCTSNLPNLQCDVL